MAEVTSCILSNSLLRDKSLFYRKYMVTFPSGRLATWLDENGIDITLSHSVESTDIPVFNLDYTKAKDRITLIYGIRLWSSQVVRYYQGIGLFGDTGLFDDAGFPRVNICAQFNNTSDLLLFKLAWF